MTPVTLPGLSKYLLCSNGEVVSLWGREPAVLSGGTDKDGYRKFVLIDDDGRRRYERRAALICEAYHGPRPEGMGVRHLDGSRTNDAPANLAWGTQAENCADKIAHGTAQRGERNSRTILTEEQVRFIRQDDSSHSFLAHRFGVSRNVIFDVRRRRTWAWLT